MSKYRDLEMAIAAKVSAIVFPPPLVAINVYDIQDPSDAIDVQYPAFTSFWENTKTIDSEAIAGMVYVHDRVFFRTEITSKSSEGTYRGEAREEVYNYLDIIKPQLIGFMPNVDDHTTLSPVETVGERFYKLNSGEVGILTIWSIDWKFMGGIVTV